MKILKFLSKPKTQISDDEARHLTQQFLDGATDDSQECMLYDYYAQKTIADDLECYREMFNWYAGLRETSDESERRPAHRRHFVAVAASLTAFLLLGAGLLVGLYASSDDNSPERIYAGSYIIRNGKKITDINKILPELRQADRYVDSTLSAFIQPNYVDPEKAIISEALKNISDPEIRAMLMADIN